MESPVHTKHMAAAALVFASACAGSSDTGNGDTTAADGTGDSGLSASACADAEVDGLRGDAGCGAELFADHCATCHGDGGEGTTEGPAIGDHVVAHTDAELVWMLTAGIGDDMPPSAAGPAGHPHLVSHLRATFGEYNGEGH